MSDLGFLWRLGVRVNDSQDPEILGPRPTPWVGSRESDEGSVFFNIGSTEALDVSVSTALPTTEVLGVDGDVARVEPGAFIGVRFRVADGHSPVFVVRWTWPKDSEYGENGVQTVDLDRAVPGEG